MLGLAETGGMNQINLFACPYCGRRLSDVIERPATEAERQDVTLHAVRDRLYVPYRPIGIGLGQCPRHGLLRVRRLQPITRIPRTQGGEL